MAKVLVVDDSLSVRKVVEKALESRNMQVLSAASAAEALEQIERERPDLVVCDVLLPDKDGYQICQFVRTHPAIRRTPVLLISGVMNSTVLARAAEVQSNDVMFKPFAADELVRKIDGLLGVPTAPATNGTPPGPRRPTPASAPALVVPAPTVSPVDVVPAPPTPVPTAATLKERLKALAAGAEVRFAVLVDREGFVIEAADDVAVETEVAGALASCLAESSEGLGHELRLGALTGMMLEYERAILLVHGVGPDALLAVAVADPAALGKVRYVMKKLVPELQRALE
jgi:CheY-like chemotaxis protein